MRRPEQRIERAERMILILTRAGRRARSEWGGKVNMLINAQIETEAQIKAQGEKVNILINAQIETEAHIKGLAAAQARTDQALRTFINSLSKGRNGESSD